MTGFENEGSWVRPRSSPFSSRIGSDAARHSVTCCCSLSHDGRARLAMRLTHRRALTLQTTLSYWSVSILFEDFPLATIMNTVCLCRIQRPFEACFAPPTA